MSNYTIENLISATAGSGRVPAIKVGGQVFPMQVSGGGGGSMDFYKCTYVSSDSSMTWRGRKAVLNEGVYSFQSDSTEGLIYGSNKPGLGKVYTSNVSMQVILYNLAVLYLRKLPFSSSYSDSILHDTYISSQGSFSISNGALVFPSEGANYLAYSALQAQPSRYSILCWLKYDSQAQNSSVNTPVHWGNSLNQTQTTFFRFPYAGYFQIGIWNPYGSSYQYDDTQINIYQWTLVAITFSGTEHKVYLNGNLITTISGSTAFPLTRNLGFGSYFGYNSQHTFKGSLRGFRIIQGVLDQGEIQGIYQSEQ